MANEIMNEFPLANIVKVEIVTEETTPKTYMLTDVASEAEVTAYVSEGEEKPLRIKNVIKAQNNTEDIVMGYDIKLVNATMVAEVLALVDGGTLKFDSTDTAKLLGYDGPPVGSPVSRKLFTTYIYTEEKDVNGGTLSYVKFGYKHCKGTPVNYSLQDGEFFAPELTAKSRPEKDESPVSIEFLDQLPA
ncbi:hypothetical protein GOQ29_14400 [Clostridium sp. D2Q-14]|uniref:hypothetical protein n=1 Tax=Anaeromonas gelatinilytica TaxID=2683194 RepID=UPI00193B57F1|nr:hypothetical protein [Anaeromonas gelatinilytica]MBS4536808.1 hypothetical protein [Anaeromonas gelatinilytica]